MTNLNLHSVIIQQKLPEFSHTFTIAIIVDIPIKANVIFDLTAQDCYTERKFADFKQGERRRQ
ncbi:hypothetical protein SDC9_120861 [bioreactor metagenome]|uniref:Uncharacterized protein n=1 Tax=bioreactor metagenome TaxID=1076179 RepID=A0A645CAB9_9ZZZZ